MSQILNPNAGGGGGGSNVQTLTPNSGGPVSAVANNINDQGLAANTGGNAFPAFSYNGGAGQFNWENRAYLSPYVVDPSVTPGSRGTFTTLAAAITQAIADGATGAAGVTIYVRNITIAETITVSTAGVNISIIGTGSLGISGTPDGSTQFTGSFTNSGTGIISFSNISFTGTSTITNSSTGSIVLNNCATDRCKLTFSLMYLVARLPTRVSSQESQERFQGALSTLMTAKLQVVHSLSQMLRQWHYTIRKLAAL